MVICLPLRELSKLAMSRRKKAGVMLMFLGGGFVTIVSMLRLKYMIQFANSHNVTWDYTPIGYWSTLEVHVGIIVACLPACRSLQRRMFPSSRSPNSYYPGPSVGYGCSSKGGSPFPSITKPKGGHIDLMTAASHATVLRSRDRSKIDKEFIPLEEFEVYLGDKPLSKEEEDENEDRYHFRGLSTTQIERGSIHTDDGVVLPVQNTHGLSSPRPTYQNNGRSSNLSLSHAITVRKDYSVTVEVNTDHLSLTPPRASDDLGTRGRRESQAGLTATSRDRSRDFI